MNKALSKVLELGATPLALAATCILLVLVAVLGPFLSPDQANQIFQPLVLAVLLEAILLLFALSKAVNELNLRVAEQESDLTLHAAPYTSSSGLLDAIRRTERGSLKIVCYGTNRFGRVLEAVEASYPLIRTQVMVCGDAVALTPSDAEDIREVGDELRSHSHIAVWESEVLPTVRGAILRDTDGTPIWASASFYVVSNQRRRRGLLSEGISPVLVSEAPGSAPMRTIVDFVDSEFERLQLKRVINTDQQKVIDGRDGHGQSERG